MDNKNKNSLSTGDCVLGIVFLIGLFVFNMYLTDGSILASLFMEIFFIGLLLPIPHFKIALLVIMAIGGIFLLPF